MTDFVRLDEIPEGAKVTRTEILQILEARTERDPHSLYKVVSALNADRGFPIKFGKIDVVRAVRGHNELIERELFDFILQAYGDFDIY